MSQQWWSWVLAGIGVTGLYFAGSNRAVGWAIGLAVQVLWIGYAFATRQWGFIFSAIAYSAVNIRNWRRWRAAPATVVVPTVTTSKATTP